MVKGASGGGRRSTKKDLHKRYLNYIGWRCGQLSLRQFSGFGTGKKAAKQPANIKQDRLEG